jgi:hypothetical protein
MRHHSRVRLSVAVAVAAGMFAAIPVPTPQPVIDNPTEAPRKLSRAERREQDRRFAKAAKKAGR